MSSKEDGNSGRRSTCLFFLIAVVFTCLQGTWRRSWPRGLVVVGSRLSQHEYHSKGCLAPRPTTPWVSWPGWREGGSRTPPQSIDRNHHHTHRLIPRSRQSAAVVGTWEWHSNIKDHGTRLWHIIVQDVTHQSGRDPSVRTWPITAREWHSGRSRPPSI